MPGKDARRASGKRHLAGHFRWRREMWEYAGDGREATERGHRLADASG